MSGGNFNTPERKATPGRSPKTARKFQVPTEVPVGAVGVIRELVLTDTVIAQIINNPSVVAAYPALAAIHTESLAPPSDQAPKSGCNTCGGGRRRAIKGVTSALQAKAVTVIQNLTAQELAKLKKILYPNEDIRLKLFVRDPKTRRLRSHTI